MVESTARRLGYSGPDPIGRLLMGAKAHAIGVLPPGDMPVAHAVGSPFFREFMLGVAEVCDENDASLLVISGAENRRPGQSQTPSSTASFWAISKMPHLSQQGRGRRHLS